MNFTVEQRLVGLGLKPEKTYHEGRDDPGEKKYVFTEAQLAGHLEMLDLPVMYRIWSIEHRGWWMPAQRGYTPDATKAGLYTRDNAEDLCREANTHNTCEVMVPAFCAVHSELPER